MSRASRVEWAKRVERWRDSGLTAKEYAAQAGLKASTLSYWKWRLGAEAKGGPAASRKRAGRAALVELRAELLTVPPASMLEVVVGELSVRIPVALDEATLTRVVRALAAAR